MMTTATEPAVQVKWTGHPLVDVGVATLCALANVDDPAELTLDDLDKAGEEIRRAYETPSMTGFITSVYMNSAYVQPKTRKSNPAKYAALVTRLTRPHRSPPDEDAIGLRCVFTGQPAHLLLSRTEMPLLTGVGTLNFFPAGRKALPVAAVPALAIHSLCLGGRKSEGKLVIVHSDSQELTLRLARSFVADNRRILGLLNANSITKDMILIDDVGRELAGGWDSKNKRVKYPDAKGALSLVLSDLVDVRVAANSEGRISGPCSATVYVLNNDGRNPSLAIEHVSASMIDFLADLHGSDSATAWNAMVARAWVRRTKADSQGAEDLTPNKPNKAAPRSVRRKPTGADAIAPQPGRTSNALLQDFYSIYRNGFVDWAAAGQFVRRHLLSDPMKYFNFSGKANEAPRITKSSVNLVVWSLTTKFLTKACGMTPRRVEALRAFADRLVDQIFPKNGAVDKSLFQQLVFTTSEWKYRAILARAQSQYARDHATLLFGLDDVIEVFMSEEDSHRPNWSLVRDLLSIRLVEQLFNRGFFGLPGNENLLDLDVEAADESSSDEPE